MKLSKMQADSLQIGRLVTLATPIIETHQLLTLNEQKKINSLHVDFVHFN